MEKKRAGRKQSPRANAAADDAAGNEDNYSIGYRKPPKHGQYKKGDGRPRPGRPKGRKNIKTIFIESAYDNVPVTIDGKRQRIPKVQAAAIQLSNALASGNDKLTLKYIQQLVEYQADAAAVRPSEYPFTDVDKSVIQQIFERLRPYGKRGRD